MLSGSLLGVELRGKRSLPVGALRIVDMYPLDFEEYCYTMGVGSDVITEVRRCFVERRPATSALYERMLSLFHSYLMVGGMPVRRRRHHVLPCVHGYVPLAIAPKINPLPSD